MAVEPCTCPGPGYCYRYERLMLQREYELCSGACPPGRPCTPAQTEKYQAYWRREREAQPGGGPPALKVTAGLAPVPCWFRGGPTGELRECATCGTSRGGKAKIRLKTFHCRHPSHGSNPTTTERECGQCPDYMRPPGEAA